MDKFFINKLFINLKEIMLENKQFLTELDAALGDGDLGLTMSKGFNHLGNIVAEITGNDIGKILYKLGFEMSNVVPSTMGTLMGSGLMTAGKALVGTTQLEKESLAILFQEFENGLMHRGKAKPGEKTVLDSIHPAVASYKRCIEEGLDIQDAMQIATNACKEGLDATIHMKSTYGKAAVFQEQSIGKLDPGATVGWLFISAFNKTINT